ncbi:MAG: DUF2666 family protein, partial [Candidatus Micrarchaeia archaeon]
MEGDDEILFVGKFKEFNVGMEFSMAGKNDSDAAFALASISEAIEGPAFQFSGIDCEKVRKIANPSGTGVSAIVDFLSKNKPNELRAQLLSACSNPLLISVAEAYFFNQLFEKACVAYKLTPKLVSSSLKQLPEKPEDQMAILGKYGNWISIKKLSIEKNTEDWEVSGILSSINVSIVSKAFDFVKASGIPITITGRKSYGNVLEALKKFVPSGNAINDAFVINKTMEGLGYKPYAHPDMLTPAHPEVKAVKL